MTLAEWKRLGIVAGAVGACIVLVGYALPLAKSDPPPWAGTSRVKQEANEFKKQLESAKNEVMSTLLYSRIFNLRTAQCQAIKAGNGSLSQAIAQQISDAERMYIDITGTTVMLLNCVDL